MTTFKYGVSLSALLLGVAGLVACNEQKTSPTRATAPSASQVLTADSKLTQALAPPSGSPSARGSSGDGPPQRGVFEQGQADARHGKGAPIKIQLGSPGAEPKYAIGPGAGDVKGPFKIIVSVHTGPRAALPTVDLALAVKMDKPKDKLSDGGVALPAIIAKVDKATLSAAQPGQVPAGTDKEIAKLNGSVMRIVPAAAGGAGDIELTVAKDVSAELKFVLFGAADALYSWDVAVPGVPVGVGAAWIAESRNKFSGVDVVTYRLYKVKSIDKDGASLDVEMRQYAASAQDSIEGLPPGGLQQFDSTSHGTMKLTAGETLASQADFDQRRTMLVQDGQRMLTVQLQTEAKISR
jgi:hypothetical protein